MTTLQLPNGAQLRGELPTEKTPAAVLAPDLFWVQLPNGVFIDVGWHPAFDPAGQYVVTVFLHEWDNQLRDQIFIRDTVELLELVQRLVYEHAESIVAVSCSETSEGDFEFPRWLSQAEQTIREGVNRGLVEFTPEIREAFETLYVSWLNPCESVEKWVAINQERGYSVDNLMEFLECCDNVKAWIEECQWHRKAKRARSRLSQSESW